MCSLISVHFMPVGWLRSLSLRIADAPASAATAAGLVAWLGHSAVAPLPATITALSNMLSSFFWTSGRGLPRSVFGEGGILFHVYELVVGAATNYPEP
jgi:hypothetical protein